MHRAVILAAVGTLTVGPSLAVAAGRAPNRTMSGHVSTCVAPRHPSIAAYALDGARLPFRIAPGHEPRCRDGRLRILRISAVTIDGEPAYVRRGGCEAPGRHRCTRQATAHVLASGLGPVRLAPAERNGNGAPAPGCTRSAHVDPAAVRRALDGMYYKRPSDLPGRSIAGARWSNYGDPGRRFGRVDLTYLLWNLPRRVGGVLPGGGIVEAVLRQGTAVALCDAPTLTLAAYDARGRANGTVRFAYAAVTAGAATLYGWVLRGYAPGAGRSVTTLRLDARDGASERDHRPVGDGERRLEQRWGAERHRDLAAILARGDAMVDADRTDRPRPRPTRILADDAHRHRNDTEQPGGAAAPGDDLG